MTSTYYVGTGVSGRPALFRKDGAAVAQELVEGVEDMQVLYGIDTGWRSHAESICDGQQCHRLGRRGQRGGEAAAADARR